MGTPISLKSFLGLKVAAVGLTGLLALAACGSSGNTNNDMAAKTGADMTFFSCCGHPGDTGNSLGIGSYCTTQAQCNSNTLCAAVYGAPSEHSYFCTKECNAPSDAGVDTKTCAENTTCTQDSVTHLYGCVPNSCLTNIPPGCTP
jgi:hypothetical protein